MPQDSIFKPGQIIKENCKCHKEVNGTIDYRLFACFLCPFCGNQWKYRLAGKGKGSRFSTADLNRILKTRPVSLA